MKKIKKFVAIFIVAITMYITTEANAASMTYNWSLVKVPGQTCIGIDVVEMPSYDKELTYKVSQLGGDCTCLIAKAESSDNDLYYINNSLKCIMLTTRGTQKFYMKITEKGKDKVIMKINCSIIQNADISKLVHGSGSIYN